MSVAEATTNAEVDESDFPSGTEAPSSISEQQSETNAPESSVPENAVEAGSDYDFDDDLGESDPPAESAVKPDIEPANSGVVDDGESFPPELLKLTNLDATRAKAAFGTPERLEQAWLNQVLNAGREAELQRQQQSLHQRQPQQPSSPAVENTAQAAPTQQELEDYLRLKLELPDEFADVEDNKLLFDALGNQVSQFYGPHLRRMEENFQRQQQVLQHFVEREQREQWARHDEEFDRFIDGLPEEWHELLGKERPEIGTPQHQARAQLFHAKSMIENGSRQLGQDVAMSRALELGLRTAFPEKHDTIVKNGVTAKRNSRSRLARPTNRTGSPLSADQAAVDAVRQFKQSRSRQPVQEPADAGEYI